MKSKLDPVAKWLQRHLVWLTGIADGIVNENAEDNDIKQNESSDKD
jgi:hypothetical protein